MDKAPNNWLPTPCGHDNAAYSAGYNDGWHDCIFDPSGFRLLIDAYRLGYNHGQCDAEQTEDKNDQNRTRQH